MKHKIVLVLLLAFFSFKTFKTAAQAINVQDSLALVDFYDSTGGPNWINHTNWLTSAPVSTWFGITLRNGRVDDIGLKSNNLIGTIPSSIGNLTGLFVINLNLNQLSGSIPSSVGNLSQLYSINVEYNELGGILPLSLLNIPNLQIDIIHNQFTFSYLEAFGQNRLSAYNQIDIPLIKSGNILSVAAGGTLSNNTYQWYNGNIPIATKTGDSTLTISADGDYSVAVTNSVVNFTLYSIDTTNKQDSLALVDFYNHTNGPSWVIHSNWLTSTPVCNWFGVRVSFNRVNNLSLTTNNLNGYIPASFGDLTRLGDLDLSYNHIHDTIPSSFTKCDIYDLDLGHNQLTGNIPSGISDMVHLEICRLDFNRLSGSIPSTFGKLSLNWLFLDSNNLSGNIPASLGDMGLSTSILDLSKNQLSGDIPISLGKLQNIMNLNLSNNHLTGTIPDTLSSCKELNQFDLSNNQLSGHLPDSIGRLTNLSDFEVNNNQLTGAIPSSILTMTRLGFNFSYNMFTFSGIENLPYNIYSQNYVPQANIPLTRHEEQLSVSAGGTLVNDTFRLYKNDTLIATQVGDSVFSLGSIGKYYINTTNRLATALTLYSDTLTIGFMLADTTLTVAKNIAGSSSTNVDSAFFKLVSITPTSGPNALNGNVTTIVAIDSSIQTFHNQPYVQRHYDITPATNPTSAQASVTLYFTQQDFDNFNSYVTANNLGLPLLPTGGVNNGNLRIIQLHGSFTASPDPGNYNDSTTVFITPTVTWDATDNWWVVNFPVNGFSGFFVSTANFTLPLTLLEFKGKLQNDVVALEWLTSNEISTKDFTIERSSDGHLFNAIGKVAAVSTPGNHGYTFTDDSPLTGTDFYRLLMTDIDGHSSFSNIVPVQVGASLVKISVYPNPTNNFSVLEFNNTVAGKYIISITDQSGRLMKKLSGVSIAGVNKISIDLHRFSKGNYFITLSGEGINTHSLKIGKE